MNKNPLDLPEESLASLDEFGNRIFIYPAKVRGFFHKKRTQLQVVLMLIFLILPWTEINGVQTVLLDIPGRRFTFFGGTFWAHDGPLIFFVLAFLTMGLALLTAVWGRIWCGWACPQTVFIEMIFRRIEEWVEGNHIERRKLNQQEWSFSKFSKKTLKWAAYTLVSLVIAHSFLAYFVGAETLLEMIQHSPRQNWTVFWMAVFFSGVTLFDFGWFREQFCIIMCPYGRFQSVLMDEHSLAILYNTKRGEPRKAPGLAKQEQGDCINCYKCVAVCPTAIDIRRGVQMECIACTACADACDEVMTKIGKPTGLIGYSSETRQQGQNTRFFRPRTWVYLGLLFLITAGLLYSLSRRQDFHLALVRAIETPYQLVQDGSEELVINHFKLKIKSQSSQERILTAEVLGINGVQLVSPYIGQKIRAGQSLETHLFIKFPPELLNSQGQKVLEIEFFKSQTVSAPLVGPQRL